MSRDHWRVIVSIGTGACLLFAAVASALVGSHREAPAYALSSSVVFYLERFVATLAGSYVVLAVVVRGLIGGELPTAISKEGLIWPENAARGTDDAIAALQAQIEEIELDVQELSERAVLRNLP